MNDLTITCVDCGKPFVWTERDQHSYREKGWSAPKRCEGCRARKKSERQAQASLRWWHVPLYRYALLWFGLSLVLTVVLWHTFRLDVLLWWLVAVTVVTVAAYGYDKSIAGSGWMRVPEAILLALAFLGGTLGAIAGMQVFRHKTVKASFRQRFWWVVLAQIAILAVYVWWRLR
jgi:uncharacterized membrane protein YsdA (DUF1294 family)